MADKKYISEAEWDAAYKQMRGSLYYELGDKWYTRIEPCSIFGEDGTDNHFGVNWKAIGTVEPSEALEFAEMVKKAAEIIAEFPYDGYHVLYEF